MKNSNAILLVEDDAVDAMTIQRILKEIEVGNRLDVVKDGEEALAFLRDPDTARPGIILLDLNMPRMNGIEFLRIIKRDEKLKMVPVVVLTTSMGEQEKNESFRLGVSGYMIKPVAYQKFVEIIATIDRYWTLSALPD